MNLKEFMAHGQTCPVCCTNGMNMKMGDSKQSYQYDNFDIFFTREMRSLQKSNSSYAISYAINKETNKFNIEFMTNSKRLDDSVHISILRKFRELDKNISTYYFKRECTNCKKYTYQSNTFSLNYVEKSIGDLFVSNEYFGICKKIGDKYRIFKIDNDYNTNQCSIDCLNSDHPFTAEMNWVALRPLHINLESISFTTEDEMFNRLNKLLPFA